MCWRKKNSNKSNILCEDDSDSEESNEDDDSDANSLASTQYGPNSIETDESRTTSENEDFIEVEIQSVIESEKLAATKIQKWFKKILREKHQRELLVANEPPTPGLPITVQQHEDASGESSEDELTEGDVFDTRDTVVQHPLSCQDNNGCEVQNSPPRQRKLGTSLMGRPIDERRPPLDPRRNRDIPGRIVTEGDLVRYFSGYEYENDGGEVWYTARVEKMTLTMQRQYPTFYNIINEKGESLSLNLEEGKKFEVRRGDNWERFY